MTWFPPYWAREQLTISYSGSGAYVDGHWESGVVTSVDMEGVVLDVPADQITQAGFGNETSRFIAVYLAPQDFDDYAQFCDENMNITARGVTYKLLEFSHRNKLLGHYKLIAQTSKSTG